MVSIMPARQDISCSSAFDLDYRRIEIKIVEPFEFYGDLSDFVLSVERQVNELIVIVPALKHRTIKGGQGGYQEVVDDGDIENG